MWLFIVIGCVLILFGSFELLTYLINKKHFDSEITGTVTRLETQNSQIYPVYTYNVDGKVYETLLTPELYDKKDFKVEQIDTLLYHAKNPEQIKLKKESYTKAYVLFGGSIVVGITIIVLALNGILKM